MKLRSDLLAKFAGFLGQFGALVRLGAVAQDADARVLVAENLAGVDAAHDGEIEQMLGRHSTLAPESSRTNSFSGARDDRGDAGTVQPGQRAQADHGGGDNPAGVAGGNQGVGLALLEQVHGAAEWSNPFCGATPSTGLSSMVTTSLAWRTWTRGSRAADARHGGLDFVLAADEIKLGDAGVGWPRPAWRRQ